MLIFEAIMNKDKQRNPFGRSDWTTTFAVSLCGKLIVDLFRALSKRKHRFQQPTATFLFLVG